MTERADPLDELFHWAAFVAFVEEATAHRSWPASQSVMRRAYDIYEAELAARCDPLDKSG